MLALALPLRLPAQNRRSESPGGGVLAAADMGHAATAVRPDKAGPPSLSEGSGAPAGYRIGPGDVLQISVWKEPEASAPQVVVRSDGKVSLPIIREAQAAGLTPAELEKTLTERFARFINQPEVAVLVREINSEKVYVVGAVRKEGPVRLQSSNTTVLQALAEAGGLTDYAKRKKIYVLRSENNKETRLSFNYEAVIKGEQTGQNILVRPGDTIVVPQ